MPSGPSVWIFWGHLLFFSANGARARPGQNPVHTNIYVRKVDYGYVFLIDKSTRLFEMRVKVWSKLRKGTGLFFFFFVPAKILLQFLKEIDLVKLINILEYFIFDLFRFKKSVKFYPWKDKGYEICKWWTVTEEEATERSWRKTTHHWSCC